MMLKKFLRRKKSDVQSIEELTQPLEVTHELQHAVFTLFNNNPSQTYNAKQVMRSAKDMDMVLSRELCDMILSKLQSELVIEADKDKKGGYRLTRTLLRMATGKVDMTSSGMAYIVVDDAPEGTKDIIVEPRNTMHAMHGDKVRVTIVGKRRDGRTEGEVVEILEIGKRKFVGRVQLSERFAFVVVDSRQMPLDIFVPFDNLNGAADGQKVVIEVVSWPMNSKNPVGKIIDVLGDSGDNNTEMHAILAEFGLPYHFPEELEDKAGAISETISSSEIKKRRDMRGIATFTIDPADAKDFDDALSIQKLPSGNWEIGVHIADVTHYVQPGDPIDTEAMERATSVYLVDRTVPMLPEKLSNFLCSLRPNEEKLCFSAIFEMSEEAEIVNEWFGRTVILSDNRFAYEDAQAIIEGGQGPMKDEILELDRLAKILRAARFKHGSIGFERDEAKFVLDEKGKPLSVYFKEMKDSNQLIEEFMLLANRRVAEFVGRRATGQKERTMIYRIHDTPNEEKFEKFKGFITRFGYHLKAEHGKAVAKELTRLLHEVKGKPEEKLVSTLAVRSMAKATYSTQNIGHYGLAFDFYTHFTSPIRRYPDMMVHRLLQHYLDGGKSADRDYYEQMCDHSSAQEIKAAEAERASIKYKMVEFMEDKMGTEWDGIISGVTDWGIYVELEANKIEGMVALRAMGDDFYAFDGETYSVIGHRSARRFTLGDIVRVRIKRADLARKQLDFEMVGTIDFGTRQMTTLPEPDLSGGALADNARFSRSRGGSSSRSGGSRGGSSRGGVSRGGSSRSSRSTRPADKDVPVKEDKE
ncbi:MAG: ribonuclease R [Mucinivorans sp.]